MQNEPETIIRYDCPKCHNESYEPGTIRTTGGGLSRFPAAPIIFLSMRRRRITLARTAVCGGLNIARMGLSPYGAVLKMVCSSLSPSSSAAWRID